MLSSTSVLVCVLSASGGSLKQYSVYIIIFPPGRVISEWRVDGLGIIINKLNFIVSYTPNANLGITAAIILYNLYTVWNTVFISEYLSVQVASFKLNLQPSAGFTCRAPGINVFTLYANQFLYFEFSTWQFVFDNTIEESKYIGILRLFIMQQL